MTENQIWTQQQLDAGALFSTTPDGADTIFTEDTILSLFASAQSLVANGKRLEQQASDTRDAANVLFKQALELAGVDNLRSAAGKVQRYAPERSTLNKEKLAAELSAWGVDADVIRACFDAATTTKKGNEVIQWRETKG